MKNTPTRERSWKTAPLRIDSYQKGRLFLPKGARIPTKILIHTSDPFPFWVYTYERNKITYKEGGGGVIRLPMKNTLNTVRNLKNAPSRSDSNQKGYPYRPKGAHIRTRSSNHKSNPPLRTGRRHHIKCTKKNAHPQLAKKCE